MLAIAGRSPVGLTTTVPAGIFDAMAGAGVTAEEAGRACGTTLRPVVCGAEGVRSAAMFNVGITGVVMGARAGGAGGGGGAAAADFAGTTGAAALGGATTATGGLATTGGGADAAAASAALRARMAAAMSPGLEALDRSILGFSAALTFGELEPPLRWRRTASASLSSIELEWVFLPVTPTAVRASRTAALFTSSSRARSLMRTLLNRSSFHCLRTNCSYGLHDAGLVALPFYYRAKLPFSR